MRHTQHLLILWALMGPMLLHAQGKTTFQTSYGMSAKAPEGLSMSPAGGQHAMTASGENSTQPNGDLPPDSSRMAAAGSITETDCLAHLKVLAGDSLEGRETGTPGQQKAAAYIARQFHAFGLKPAGEDGGWFQPFGLVKRGWGDVSFKAGDTEYGFLEDYFGWPGSNNEVDFENAELVFAGYGIDDAQYSDYEGLDVKGKVVLIHGGEPQDKDGNYHLTGTAERSNWTTDWQAKVKAATERGAIALITVSNSAERQLEVKSFVNYLRNPEMELAGPSQPSPFCNVLYTTPRIGGELFGSAKKLEKAIAKIDKKLSPQGRELDMPISLRIEKFESALLSENVLGMIPGSDRADEYVFVTAHYDHLGKSGELIYNGADDDASGTTALLEVAEAMGQAYRTGNGPRRNVVFMTVSGEEKGLLGSEFYSEHPIYPMEHTVADLNIDMVGRVDEEHAETPMYVYLIGSDFLSSELHEISEGVARQFSDVALDYTYNTKDDPNRYYYRSDHYNFARHGVPVIFYMDGGHEDYHQPTDTYDKIPLDVLAARTKLIFHTLWAVANRDARPMVDGEVDDE